MHIEGSKMDYCSAKMCLTYSTPNVRARWPPSRHYIFRKFEVLVTNHLLYERWEHLDTYNAYTCVTLENLRQGVVLN